MGLWRGATCLGLTVACAPALQVVDALAHHDPARPLAAVVRGTPSRAQRDDTPRPVPTIDRDDVDDTASDVAAATLVDRDQADVDVATTKGHASRGVRRSVDGNWLSAIDIVRAMAVQPHGRDERTTIRRVMAAIGRRVGRLDRVSLPSLLPAAPKRARYTKTSAVKASRVAAFIDAVAAVVCPAGHAAASMAARYKAQFCCPTPSAPALSGTYHLGEEDPLSEEPPSACVIVSGDANHHLPVCAPSDLDGDDNAAGADDRQAGDSATEASASLSSTPSRKRPRPRTIDSSDAEDGGQNEDGDDSCAGDHPAQRRRARRRAPPALRWAAERPWTDRMSDRRPGIGCVDDSDADCHTSIAAPLHPWRLGMNMHGGRAGRDGTGLLCDDRLSNGDDSDCIYRPIKSESLADGEDTGDRDAARDGDDLHADDDDADTVREQAVFEAKWNRRVATDLVERASVGGPLRVWQTHNDVCRLSLAVAASHEIAGMWEVVGGRADPQRPAPGPREEWIERNGVIAIVARALSSPATAVTVGASMPPTSPGAATVADSGLFALCRRHLAHGGGASAGARLSARLTVLVHEAADTPRAGICARLAAAVADTP